MVDITYQVVAYIDGWEERDKRTNLGPQAYGWQWSEHSHFYYYKLITPHTKEHEAFRSAEGRLIALAQELNRPLPAVIDKKSKNAAVFS